MLLKNDTFSLCRKISFIFNSFIVSQCSTGQLTCKVQGQGVPKVKIPLQFNLKKKHFRIKFQLNFW